MESLWHLLKLIEEFLKRSPRPCYAESHKLPTTKHGAQCKIALTGVEPLLDARPPDTKALLTRLQALEDLEDVQASQASRLTDLERQVFLLQAKPHHGPRTMQS